MSLKLVSFESLGMVCYSPSIINMALHYFGDKARYRSKITIFFHTPLHWTPPLGGSPRWNIAIPFGVEKLECVAE